jgi:crossover junction endodeoxyribonuclease RusA
MTGKVFHLPLPPSVNALYRNVRGKGRVKTKHYRTWLKAAGWEIIAQKGRMAKIMGPVQVTIYAVKPKRGRRRDLDNLTKALLDLMVAHEIIEDDSNVQSIYSEWVSHDLEGVSITVEAKADYEKRSGADGGAEEAQKANGPGVLRRRPDPTGARGSRMGEITKLQEDLAAGGGGSLADPLGRRGHKSPDKSHTARAYRRLGEPS